MSTVALLLVLVGGCRGERVVVLDPPMEDLPPPPIDSCERAFEEGREGDACEGLEMGCFRELGCCVEQAFCELSRLIRFEDCSGCAECGIDQDCGPGAWCLPGGDCVPCPPPGECMPCPDGLVPLVRNGCLDCSCVPPSQCTIDEECGPPMTARCVIGAFCACEDPSCCTNACAPIECTAPEPAPEGCVYPCEDPMCMGLCRNVRCRCELETWQCETECATEPFPDCGL